MTGEAKAKPIPPNWRNFDIACKLAMQAGATTAMLTGKGEPTLWPELIGEYLDCLKDYPIPIIELQTNGLNIARGKVSDETLVDWYDKGLSTIAISVASIDRTENSSIYTPGKTYPDLMLTVEKLHKIGFGVRLICILCKGYTDTCEKINGFIQYAKLFDIEQLTFLPVSKPDNSSNAAVSKWVEEHTLSRGELREIHKWLEFNGMVVLELPHGAKVYDIFGQNVCMNNCLDPRPTSNDQIRNLIYFPDGRIQHRWDAKGSIIL
jgi:molybdenum cofactor biosynthesis enzyme MoaA